MSDKKTVIALGYFDSVHKGHRLVMETARRFAEQNDADFVVFTFGGNLKAMLLGEQEKYVYSPIEREKMIKELGADQVFFAPVTKEFLSKDKTEFLDYLNEKYNVLAYVSGSDYRFGKNGSGNVEFLEEYANKNNQRFIKVEMLNFYNEKISTTRIKGLLAKGNISYANRLLGKNYFITGNVVRDRGVGKKLGFPTVNIKLEKDKFKLRSGVYKGRTTIDGKEYKTIINYGARPTFSLEEKLVEAHVIDYEGDLYDREITLVFDEFMREIKKFESKEQLIEQLKIDIKSARG